MKLQFPSPRPWHPLFCPFELDTPGTSYRWVSQYLFFWLISQPHVLGVLCGVAGGRVSSLRLNDVLSCGQTACCSSLPRGCPPGSCPPLAVVNDVAVAAGVRMAVRSLRSALLGTCTPRSGSVGSCDCSIARLLKEPPYCFPEQTSESTASTYLALKGGGSGGGRREGEGGSRQARQEQGCWGKDERVSPEPSLLMTCLLSSPPPSSSLLPLHPFPGGRVGIAICSEGALGGGIGTPRFGSWLLLSSRR